MVTLQENTKKSDLIEIFQKHFQTTYRLPPLDSKIVALLIIEDQGQGITFEQLMNMTECSKSSISVSLKKLVNDKKVFFTKKENGRKRYFKICYMFEGFCQLLKKVEIESKILDQLIFYKVSNSQNQEVIFENIVEYRNCLSQLENFLLKNIPQK